jgi:tetratricopeptide (TPR) repeat protein
LKPGVFAPGREKAFYKAVQAYVAGDIDRAVSLFRESSQKDSRDVAVADDLFAGLLLVQTTQHHAAIPYLEKVIASDVPLPDALMNKYVPGGHTEVEVTPGVAVEVPFGSLAAALALVECYQGEGREEEAIGLLQQLVEVEPDPGLVLSLCELLSEAGFSDEIVELAAGTRNGDDVSLQIVLYQAAALEDQRMNDAAAEVYKEALRSKKRNPDLLKEARYRRGRLYLTMGKKAQGKRDLAQVYADDPDFADVAEILGSIE